MLKTLKERSRRNRMAECLCAGVSAHARNPVFFGDYKVANSVDGRFDLVVLHAWLALDRLQSEGEGALAQSLVNALFVRLEEALREQGVGDLGLARRMKRMAGAFYGRLRAYGEAGDEHALAAALARNLYRGDTARVEAAPTLAKYVSAARVRLAGCRLGEGQLEFGPVPARTELKADEHGSS